MKMRIVGMNTTHVFIQTLINNEWKLNIMNEKEFKSFMYNMFPTYMAEYEKDTINTKATDFFYHYGETEDMRRKGEAYIFKA